MGALSLGYCMIIQEDIPVLKWNKQQSKTLLFNAIQP
jgi:hypothetical protein